MTSQQERLEELQQQAKALAEQIEQLEEQISHTQPTTGLLGRWARHEKYGHVLIACQHADEHGWLFIAYPDDGFPDGAAGCYANQRDLTFPEQTTSPQDVPVGEAWLVNTCDGIHNRVTALKVGHDEWRPADNIDRMFTTWCDEYVTLITPLIPARPHDTPETVTTEEEYAQLPEGSIVAVPGSMPWIRRKYAWVCRDDSLATAALAGATRHILRRGRGE